MKKRGFTILEMILVVAILWLLFSMTRSFFNVWRQKKIVFWETCLNYIFGEVDKFQTDIKYGKLPVTVSGLNGVYSLRLFGNNGGPFNNSSGFAGYLFEWLGDDYATIQTYKTVSLSSNNYSTFNNTSIPAPCYSNEYVITARTSIWSRVLQVAIPTVKTNSSQRFIGEERETNTSPQITWDVTYSVCWLPKWHTNPSRANMVETTECIEIGKVNVDKRSETINFLKCGITNQQSGICTTWPRLN